MVDDNNEPAPKNVPADGAPPVNGEALLEGQKGGWDGIDCQAIVQGSMYNGPTFANKWSHNGMPFINIFLHFLLCYFLEVTIVEATSNMLLTANVVQTTLGELLRYIRMMLLMSCYMKFPNYFWKTVTRTGNESEDEVNNIPLFTFNWYMSHRHFLAITSVLWFTLKQLLLFQDKFWQIRELISMWDKHMYTIFSAAWALCLDKLMSIWFNQWTCPGWVFCPREPHPFGNEYHTACCGLLGIMFSMEMVEGKDHPPQIAERLSELGKTTGLLLWMLATYFSTRRYVILNSGFCILKSFVELKRLAYLPAP